MTLVLNGTTGVSAVDGSAATPAIQGNDSNTGMFFPAADTIAFAEGGAEVARFDSSGNLGIGTSSPADRLQVTKNGAEVARFTNSLSNGGDWEFKIGGGGFEDRKLMITDKYSGADNVRVSIDSSGNLLVGTTSVYDNSRFTLETSSAQPNGIAVKTNGNNNALAFWRNSTTYAGAITLSASGTAYTSASDYRLKEQVQPMTGALAKVAALKPVTYKWKSDGSDGQGFIAHELQEVVPDCVTGEKDAVNEDGSIKPQGIDTSFLVATLTAAIQEQQALIAALQADVAALKGQA